MPNPGRPALLLLLLLRLAPAAGGQQPDTIGHAEDLEAALELNRQAREAGEDVPGTAESPWDIYLKNRGLYAPDPSLGRGFVSALPTACFPCRSLPPLPPWRRPLAPPPACP